MIGTVAQIRLGKGIDVLLAAAESLLAEFPDVIFAIVGPPGRGEEEFAARMVDAAKKEPLAGRVRFVGSRPDVPDVLASFDIFCLPTRAETFGIAVVEAMAAGLPVVAGDVGALRELVTSPDVGIR